MASLRFSCRFGAGLQSPKEFNGLAVEAPRAAVNRGQCRGPLVCIASAEAEVSKRALLVAAGSAAFTFLAAEDKALAAYGEAANIFAPYRGKTDFYEYQGDGFSINVPSKWNPSKELGEFPNVVVRYEDNFDATSNLVVIAEPTTLSSVKDLGTPEDFIEKYKYLLGLQSFDKETASEGGFVKNTTLTAALIDSGEFEKDGKTYYKVSILSRTADGDEGGKHQLFTAAVSGKTLYILKVQAGDKRWFKGTRKFVEGADASFTVA